MNKLFPARITALLIFGIVIICPFSLAHANTKIPEIPSLLEPLSQIKDMLADPAAEVGSVFRGIPNDFSRDVIKPITHFSTKSVVVISTPLRRTSETISFATNSFTANINQAAIGTNSTLGDMWDSTVNFFSSFFETEEVIPATPVVVPTAPKPVSNTVIVQNSPQVIERTVVAGTNTSLLFRTVSALTSRIDALEGRSPTIINNNYYTQQTDAIGDSISRLITSNNTNITNIITNSIPSVDVANIAITGGSITGVNATTTDLNVTGTLAFDGLYGSSGQVLTSTGTTSTPTWTTLPASQWTTTGSDIYFNTGNVGVGTTTPSQMLTVYGNVLVSSSSAQLFLPAGSASTPALSFSADSNTGIYSTGSDTMRFAAGGAETALLNSSLFRLNGSQFTSTVSYPGTAATPLYGFASEQTGFYRPSSGAIGFTSLGAEKMRIDASGNLGIGTTSPQYKLHIASSGANGIMVQNTTGGGGVEANIDFLTYGEGYEAYPSSRIAAIDDGSYSNHLSFLTKDTGSPSNSLTERLRITAGGSVGIGMNNPSYFLDVNGSIGNSSSGTWSIDSSGVFNGYLASTIQAYADNVGSYDSLVNNVSGRFFDTYGYANNANYVSYLDNSQAYLSGYGSTEYLINGNGQRFFDTNGYANYAHYAGNTTYAGSSGQLYYYNGTALTDTSNNLFYPNGNYLADTNGNLFYPNGNYLADSSGNLYDGANSGSYFLDSTHLNLRGRYISNDGGDEGIVVDNDGNVGVGTTTPGSILTLGSGQLELPVGTAGAPSLRFSGASGAGIRGSGSGGVIVSTGGTDRMEFTASGNTFVYTNQLRVTANTAAAPAYSFFSDATVGMDKASGISALTFSTAGAERVRFDASGRVGIGTTTPGNSLEIYAANNGNIPEMGTVFNSASVNLKIRETSYSEATTGATYLGHRGYTSLVNTRSSGGGGISFITGASTSTNTFIDRFGYFTIGSTTNTTTGFNSQLAVYNTSASNSIFDLHSSTLSEVFTVLNSGNVGLGTTTPGLKLSVSGGDIGIDAGYAYKYNGVNMITASTSLPNYFFGNAGNLSMTGNRNTGVGHTALGVNTTGQYNTGVGYLALSSNTTGSQNTAFGNNALNTSTSTSNGTAVGYRALYFSTGEGNTALGSNALFTNTSGQLNVGVGYNSMFYNTTGSLNVAVGGFYGVYYNTTGSYNIGIGAETIMYNQGGSNNVAMGYQALRSGTLGDYSNNVAIGHNALKSTIASNNTAIGYAAGDNLTTGTGNVILGYNIDFPSATTNNQLNIGNIIFGTTIDGTGTTLSTGNIGVGTTSPGSKFTLGSGQLEVPAGSLASPSLVFTGDTNSGLYSYADGGIGYSSNGTQKFRFDGTGMVVVGTGNASSDDFQTYVSGGKFGIGTNAASEYFFGFGVASTGGLAGFYRDSSTGVIEMRTQNYSLANFGIKLSNAANSFYIKGASSQTGDLQQWKNSADSVLSVITKDGNLGIGTTTPGARLHSLSTTEQLRLGYDASNYLSSTVGSTGGVTFDAIGSGSAFNFSDSVSINSLISLTTTGTANFQNGAPAGFKMGADVNTTTRTNSTRKIAEISMPGYTTASNSNTIFRGDITGSSLGGAYFGGVPGSSNYAMPNLYFATAADDTTNGVGIIERMSIGPTGIVVFNETGTDSDFRIEGDADANLFFTDASTDRVGLGTSTPSAQLTTTGTVRFAGITGGTLTADSLGNVTASSDENLKDITGEFTRGLEDIQKINPISYHWKESTGYDTANLYSGFSAQNLQLAIPEAVLTNTNGFLTLQDRPILAAAINAIKQLGSVFLKIEDGIAYMKSVVVERFTIGSPEKPAGITIYDQATGSPYCIKVVNGTMMNVPGACGSELVVTPSIPVVETPVTVETPDVVIPTPDESATSTPEETTIPTPDEATALTEEVVITPEPVILEEVPVVETTPPNPPEDTSPAL